MAIRGRAGWIIGIIVVVCAVPLLMAVGHLLHHPDDLLLQKLGGPFTTSYEPYGPFGGPFRYESRSFTASPSQLVLINKEATTSNGWVKGTTLDGSYSYKKSTTEYEVVINITGFDCHVEEIHKISPGAYIFRL